MSHDKASATVAEKRKPKALAHGPTLHAIKRAKYAAKQEHRRQSLLQQQQSSSHPRTSWFSGREEYAAFVTVEDVRDIRSLRKGNETSLSANEEGRMTRLRRIGGWIEPFFDLKEMPNARNDNERERLFISEGTEAVRMMVQNCEPTPSTTSSSTSSGDDGSVLPNPRLLSILAKPATFFDSPIRLLGDIERQNFINESSAIPPFKIIIANEDALSEIAGFNIARGAMACGVIPSYMQNNGYTWLKRLLFREPTKLPPAINTTLHQKPIRKLLALDAISNAANMGSILRTAAAFSIDAIILSDDSCDAWYRQSVRVSMGHVISVNMLRVADWERGRASIDDGYTHTRNGLAGVMRWLRKQMNVECLAAVVDDINIKTFPPLVTLEDDQDFGGRPWCCVLGNEGHGIRDEVIRECDKRVKIGMANGVDSLSLPIAAGILMHRLSCI